MQKKLTLFLVVALALSLLFCFGSVAAATHILPACTCGCCPEGCECAEGDCDCPADGGCQFYVAADEETVATGEEEEETAPPVVTAAPVTPTPEAKEWIVTKQKLTIDGEEIPVVAAFNIDGYNYFKLRDIAALLTGSGSQFNIEYVAPNINVTTGEAYEKQENDLKEVIKEGKCVPSPQKLFIDGEEVAIWAYNINGNNYFQLRGLGELIGFDVSYETATKTMVVKTKAVEEQPPVEGEEGEEGEEGVDETTIPPLF